MCFVVKNMTKEVHGFFLVFFWVKNGLEYGFLEFKNLNLDFSITKATSNDQKRWHMDGSLCANMGDMWFVKIKKKRRKKSLQINDKSPFF